MNTVRNEGMYLYNKKLMNNSNNDKQLMVIRKGTDEARYCLGF